MRNGICVAGNAILDILLSDRMLPWEKRVDDHYGGITRATGGALCNVAMDLASLDPSLELSAVGIIGDDADGDFIEQQLEQYENISLSGLKREGRTSFTIVMCENTTKHRTFFQYRGANAQLCEADFDWDKIDAKILHIGYILLDALDQEDAQYGTKMARLLREAKAAWN